MRRSRGFTLIEALVALVVLSIGLLGVAALQLSSLRSNGSASMRSQATLLAYDIVDRMRANQVAARNTAAYDITFTATPTTGTVAGDDLTRWRQSLKDTLGPDATGQISRTGAGNATTFVVRIRWIDLDDAGTARGQFEFLTETQL